MGNKKICDLSLQYLSLMQNLNWMTMFDTECTVAEVERFKAQKIGCHVDIKWSEAEKKLDSMSDGLWFIPLEQNDNAWRTIDIDLNFVLFSYPTMLCTVYILLGV